MKKISVCIISKQLVPNYLFLQETKKLADEVLLVASREFEKEGRNLCELLKTLDYKKIELLVFSENDVEEKWNQMTQEIVAHLNHENHYLVNLTGGTKYMSLAVQKVFENFKSDYFYIPSPKNYFIQPMKDDTRVGIKHRIKVKEALSIFGVELKSFEAEVVDRNYTNKFFNLFVNGKLNFKAIEKLRELRNNRNVEINSVSNLRNLLERSNFLSQNSEKLSRKEVGYLTGGWFEEYVFNHIKEHVKPDDIKINLKTSKNVKTSDSSVINEFDVCFTLNNKFFVVECKTGGTSKESDFNPIAYKAKALKESLMGLTTKFYIFTLGDVFKRAETMGISCFGREHFIDKEKFQVLLDSIIEDSKR